MTQIKGGVRLEVFMAVPASNEQIADVRHARTHERRHASDVIGGVDGCGVELDRIDGLRGAGELRLGRRRIGRPGSACSRTKTISHNTTRGNAPSPRTAAVSPLAAERFETIGLATSGHPACCTRA